MILVSVTRIWDASRHNAFTDLTRFGGRWFCAFRESTSHMHGMGKIRVISSKDGRGFSSSALFARRGVDLRDPKLSVTPQGQLMLLAGGSRFRNGEYVGRRPWVSFSSDGTSWSAPISILDEGDWLWRVAWNRGCAYGISYRLKSRYLWHVELFRSENGVDYQKVCRLGVTGRPNEATIRFFRDHRAIALVRREGGDRSGWIGTSSEPFTDWDWHPAGARFGGPNFLVLRGESMIAASREITKTGSRTVVAELNPKSYHPALTLPSGGDCSYPGMVEYRGRVWISYYSSHESVRGERSAIYLAVIDPEL